MGKKQKENEAYGKAGVRGLGSGERLWCCAMAAEVGT